MRRLTTVLLALVAAVAAAAPVSAAWGPPQQMGDGAAREVVANPRGDVAVLTGGAGGISVAVAPAGAGFGAPERVTSHAPYFADIALAGNGDVFVIAEGPNGGHEVHVRPAGGRFAPPQLLEGVGQFADVAAGPDGQGLVAGTSGDRAVSLWWREPGGTFVRTAQRGAYTSMRANVAFAGQRAMVAWASGRDLVVAELRDGTLEGAQVLAQADQMETSSLTGTPRGDLLLRFQARNLNDPGFPHRAMHAAPGQPLAEVPSPAILDEDGTLAVLQGGTGPIEVRPPAGPPEVVPMPADVSSELGPPRITFNPEGRLEAFGTRRRSATDVQATYAQRAPDGSWCPARVWDGRAVGPILSAGEGARGVAAWTTSGPFTSVSWFRPGEGCPAPYVEPASKPKAPEAAPAPASAPLAAPRGLAAARRGTRVTVRWRAVSGAARYRVTARLANGKRPRYVRRPSSRRAVIGGVRPGARVTVTVRGVARNGRAGRPAKLRVRARR